MTITDSPTNADLARMVGYLNQPVSPEFAVNRYPQDVPMLVRHILQQRREQAELLRVLHELPLDGVTPDDTPLQIVERARAFWVEYQQGLWGERETARLKKSKERVESQLEESRGREARLVEKIAGLERAAANAQVDATALQQTINELTNSLAAAVTRETALNQRVQVLDNERGELESRHALEQRMAHDAHVASESQWREVGSSIAYALEQITSQLHEQVMRAR